MSGALPENLALPVIGSVGPRRRGIGMSPEDLARGLANAVEGEVRLGLHDRMLYATDASLYQVEPLGVVIPASVEDAWRAVEFCAAHGLPVLPRGGGTSLAGQCTNRAVVIDVSAACRRVISADLERGEVEVEPGITVDELNEWIVREEAERGGGRAWYFAPDPATSRQACIGGCIGNNAAGARSILYGRTSESVLGVSACGAGGLAEGGRESGGAWRLEFFEGAALKDARVGEITERVARVVLAHRRLIRERFARTIRRNAGYNLDLILDQLERPWSLSAFEHVNLAHLLCGSEGTLALTLGAKLKLRPRPAARGLAVLAFSSLDGAIAAVGPILETRPSAVELLDDLVIDLAKANAECRRYVELLPSPSSGVLRAVLYVEYFAAQADGLADRFVSLGRLAAGCDATMGVYTDAKAMLDAWKLRKAGEPLLHGIAGSRKPITFVEDNAVPVEHLAEFVREFRAIVERHGTRAAFYAHASVGVLHVRPLLDVHDGADRERMKSIAVEAADLARSLGGVMSGEHGDGRARTPLLERFYGPELMGAMREIKRIFDPAGLFNPGNIVGFPAGEEGSRGDGGGVPGSSARSAAAGAASIAERLRVRPGSVEVRVAPARTFYDYSDQHGLAGAVEMCNGAGVCRKKSGGTMCPSYMGTLDERHSTRGRGNALRLAITGQLGDGGSVGAAAWRDAETMRTLDLCLSCKACRTECPSNVDVSRLKAEYVAQGYEQAGRAPVRAMVLGAVRALNRCGSVVPRVANGLAESGVGRAFAEWALGIDRRRSLPRFKTSLARRWRAESVSRSGASVGGGLDAALGEESPAVVLFGDCFTMYNEPGIGLSARRVLEACGYRVLLADAGCCGRAKISMGLLASAVDGAERTLERLGPLLRDRSVRAFVFAEPSCLSAVRDDWLMLKMRVPLEERRELAGRSWLVEEFVERFWESHPRTPLFGGGAGEVGRGGGGPPAVLLHAHCHQKALWGSESSAALLRRVYGNVRVLDSGCCGMAGAFGFMRGKYELSMKIGELTLMPAVRGEPGAIIAAPGTSCRHQIFDGARRRARHPIELAAERLER